MAPVKPGIQRQRDLASSAVLSALEVACCPAPSSAADMSEVKGLFTRSYKQDQWDWFTVWTQLGRPGRKLCRLISGDLGELRRAVLDQDVDRAEATRGRLRQAGTAALLRGFLNPWPGGRPEAPGTGFVYILSTRTSPQLLKIGYTERTVEQRLKEINRGTGVAEPYGARAVWTVQNAPQVEKAVHETLAGYRVRADREFFELPYGAAYAAIRDIVDASRREL